VQADVLGGPADAEVVAAGAQLPDEVGECLVVGVAAGFGVLAELEALGLDLLEVRKVPPRLPPPRRPGP
jgi:hypothetical protein